MWIVFKVLERGTLAPGAAVATESANQDQTDLCRFSLWTPASALGLGLLVDRAYAGVEALGGHTC